MKHTFVVGDIHGCSELLRSLLRKVDSHITAEDRVVFLGDYIDRGPDSRGVIEQLLALRDRLGDRLVCLKGNHEEWLIQAIRDSTCTSWLLGMGGLSTVRSYAESAVPILEEALGRQFER